ncbi:MAG: CDP-glycerol:glycerophosphate glycerophosphotransferase [Desulfovibrionaceae bacterium]|nr:CDP-glycerol:glycerophosphate glycerophosphotransferase [Desulfovibrionaceae bacterium]
MTAISIIIATRNAAPYLPRFFRSLQEQTFGDYEALFIDDASSDDSAALVETVGDRRFKLLRQAEQSGAGAARNLGIRSAEGETICFADPDDWLPPASLEARYAAFKKHNAVIRACHKETTDDGQILNHEIRPSLPEVCHPAEEAERLGAGPFLRAHWTWLFPANMLRREGIFHGENMRTAEDIFMLARLFFHVSKLVWLPDIVYHWLKRPGSLSNTKYTPEHYADYFRCCDIFYNEAAQHKRLDLADAFCNEYMSVYLPHLLEQASTGKSSEADAIEVILAAARVCKENQTFNRCRSRLQTQPAGLLGLFWLRHVLDSRNPSMIQRLLEGRAAAAHLLQAASYERIRRRGWQDPVVFDKFDQDQGLLRARYLFCDRPPEEKFTKNNAPLPPAFAKNRLIFRAEGWSISERILWLPVAAGSEADENAVLDLRVGGLKSSLTGLTPAAVLRAFAPAPLDDRAFPPDVRALRRLAQSPAMRETFGNAWMFMDRDTQADDNAEHLYRWVRQNHPEINAWFVLREESPDWPRLRAEGFRLVPFGGLEHKALFLLAKAVISSQTDVYIYAFLEDEYYADLRRFKYVNLRHGVIHFDLSPWLNNVDIDLSISTTGKEYHSIVDDGTGYTLTAKETILAGQARHDRLRENAGVGKNLFIMPTWRANLTGVWDGAGQRREYNPAFIASDFARTWKSLLASPDLERLCLHYGYAAIFWPHPGFRDYLAEFSLPAHVRTPAGESIQTLLQESALLITDYSSIAFDMALLRRPVLYYHFENQDHFLESQGRKESYFRHDRDGFGPVCATEAALLAALEKILAASCRPETAYLARMERTMNLDDGKCCQRTFEAILRLWPAENCGS